MAGTLSYRWILLAVLLIAGVDLRLYSLAVDARQEALERAATTLRNAADVVLGRLDQELDTYDRTLSGIGEVVRSRGGLSPQPDIYLHRLLLRRHAITPGLRWLFLVREDGRLAELSSDFPAPSLDISDRDYFQIPAENWERDLFVGAPLESRHDHLPFVPISRRVVNDGNRFLGVTVGAIAPAELQRLLAEEALGEGYSLRLLLTSGRALTCLPAGGDCLQRDWGSSPFLGQWLEGPARGSFAAADLGDPGGPGAYARSERYPVLVAASADEGKLLAAWQESLAAYWAIAAVSNLILIGLLAYAYRQVQRRRRALGDLARANAVLEARVAQRTEELRQREAQARIFMNTALDAVVVIDGDSRICEFNGAAERMFGYRADEIIGQNMGTLMAGEAAVEHRQFVQAAGQEESVRAMGRGREVWAQSKDGHRFPIEVSVGSSSAAGSNLHVGIIRDISERKQVEQELQRLATTDGLTETLNRRAFTGEGERLVALARRHGHPLAVMILDADKFKNINDRYGHPVGDLVLKALARAVAAVLRQTDVFGRLGGEEFGLILPETDAAGAEQLGQRLLAAVRACRVPHGEQQLSFSISIGVALLGAPPEDLASALRQADAALYAAKEGGRDRLVLAPPIS